MANRLRYTMFGLGVLTPRAEVGGCGDMSPARTGFVSPETGAALTARRVG